MESPKKEDRPLQAIQLAPSVQRLYANGFLIGLSLSDLNIVLTINGQPTHQVMMSLISAKTLMSGLKTAIEDFENKTKTTVPEMKEVQSLLEKK